MGIICDTCGRDIDALGQDNMSCTSEPLCEDCWNEQQSHAVAVLRRENDRLRGDLAEMGASSPRPGRGCAATGRRTASGCAARSRRPTRRAASECELWLGRCELRVTASPTLKGAAQDAVMPCLKAEEARGFAMPDVNVEVKAEVTAEKLAKSLREAMKPAMRMAVE